jgi:hypothetical protein
VDVAELVPVAPALVPVPVPAVLVPVPVPAAVALDECLEPWLHAPSASVTSSPAAATAAKRTISYLERAAMMERLTSSTGW